MTVQMFASQAEDYVRAQGDLSHGGYRAVSSLMGRLFDFVLKLDIPVEFRAAARTAVLETYDTFCKEIDIPKVPEFFEVRLEASLRAVLEGYLNAWVDG